MIFTLTDILLNDIVSALENQEKKFFVDAEKGTLVEDSESVNADENYYYELPEWNSADGFRLREEFVSNLLDPIVHEKLQDILHSGRGVFKNFRNIIKEYPEIEKRWHIYKNREMHKYINQWYNELREVWGLQKLDYLSEIPDAVVYDDFTFEEYSSDVHNSLILSDLRIFFNQEDTETPSELNSAFYEMWKSQFLSAEMMKQQGYVSKSLSGEFAGCLTVSPISEAKQQIVKITSIYVPVSFRRLGIATELFSLSISELKENGIKWIIFPNYLLSETIQTLLIHAGFKKFNFGYAVKL